MDRGVINFRTVVSLLLDSLCPTYVIGLYKCWCSCIIKSDLHFLQQIITVCSLSKMRGEGIKDLYLLLAAHAISFSVGKLLWNHSKSYYIHLLYSFSYAQLSRKRGLPPWILPSAGGIYVRCVVYHLYSFLWAVRSLFWECRFAWCVLGSKKTSIQKKKQQQQSCSWLNLNTHFTTAPAAWHCS